jgi:hypothetical protein
MGQHVNGHPHRNGYSVIEYIKQDKDTVCRIIAVAEALTPRQALKRALDIIESDFNMERKSI